jgi:CubicO group peptidase (beta-lactamase class C family)
MSMIMRWAKPILLASFGLGALQAQSMNQSREPNASAIEALLKREMERRRIPGLQAAIVHRGAIVFSAAYGQANLQDNLPVTQQNLFTLNSITKSFTGVAIMQLVESKKLELDAPLSRYLDELPKPWQSLTLRQLLTHTSGLPDILNPETEMLIGPGDEASAWKLVQNMPMESKPGERFRYNQLGYTLLGKIIDKISGQAFTEFIAKQQFQAAPMPSTQFGDFYDVIRGSARGYSVARDTGAYRNVFEAFPPMNRASAGIYSTANEMARWILALQSGKLLKEKSSLKTLWTAGKLNNGMTGGFGRQLDAYALGWVTMSRKEHRAVGGIGGGRSVFLIYPEDDLSIVILTNLRGCSPESFIEEIAGYYIPALAGGLSPAINAVRGEMARLGFDHAIEVVKAQKQKDTSFELNEGDVNAWGYRLLEEKKAKEALEIFKLNVNLYPKSGNAYDSLAEAFLVSGDRAQALKNYERSLELDPSNGNAAAQIKNLKTKGGEKSRESFFAP